MTPDRIDYQDFAAVHEVAKEIARELGPPWRFDYKASHGADGQLHAPELATDTSGYGVVVRPSWRHPERIEISGRLPSKDREGHRHCTWHDMSDGVWPKISVALARGTHAVARDIVTRLLPKYAPAYAKARVDRANAELSELKRVTKLFAPYADLRSGHTYNGSSDGRFLMRAGGTARLLAYGGTVRMELEVSPELAVEIMKLHEQEARR